MRLAVEDKDLMEWGAAKRWLQFAERAVSNMHRRTNFYRSIYITYEELSVFGMHATLTEELWNGDLLYTPFTAGEYYVLEDFNGQINTLYRRYWCGARALAERFGPDKLSDKAKNAAKKKPHELIELVLVCEPRRTRDPRKIDNQNWPWRCLLFEYNRNEGEPLIDAGYQEKPFFVPRWSHLPAEAGGRGPGHDVLPDVKMLQTLTKTGAIALHKEVDPPLSAHVSLREGGIVSTPGAINYRSGVDEKTVVPLYNVKANFRDLRDAKETLWQAIREGFFNDLFLMLDAHPNMTATEVLEKKNEKLLLLGPVTESIQHEQLDQDIQRVLSALWRSGKLPDPPRELSGAGLKVEYISPLAQAVKLASLQAQQATTNYAIALAAESGRTEILDKINFDQAIDEYAEMVGAPAGIIVSDQDVAKIRAQRAEAQAKAQKKQEAMEGADMLNKIGNINPDSQVMEMAARALQGGGR